MAPTLQSFPRETLHSFFQWIFSCHCFFLLLVACFELVHTLRSFPPLFNAALERPITTNPTASTCGATLEAYCLSSTSVESINKCLQGYCSNVCPGRTLLPSNASMLTGQTYGDCVDADSVNIRPGARQGTFSTVFSMTGSTCYIVSVFSPRLDESGTSSFTVAGWVWLDSDQPGTLLEKQSTPGDILFSLRVGPSGVSLHFVENKKMRRESCQTLECVLQRTLLEKQSTPGDILFSLRVGPSGVSLHYSLFNSDLITARFDTVIALQQWTHIALQRWAKLKEAGARSLNNESSKQAGLKRRSYVTN
ncbi:uncharacterized protein LOC106051941 [Biomphalaria glabrata]|uniref:Uncharacterized protein LOC106051941 n=1 Tax=Biomphalaria glabrata TaxID=6526 RepID=A0A9W2ZWQ5_BIOGL|nr:uncharacterized protein LOC106051941 [Biomphalaria glabrata]